MRGLKYQLFDVCAYGVPSHPLRMRGLKSILVTNHLLNCLVVASLADAWIEIHICFNLLIVIIVASLADAWIEIGRRRNLRRDRTVASLADAWIEIARQT